MKKILIIASFFVVLAMSALIQPVKAQTESSFDPNVQEENSNIPIYPPDEYYRGRVLEILDDSQIEYGGYAQPYQKVKVEITNGAEKGNSYEMEYGTGYTLQESQRLVVGDEVLVAKVFDAQGTQYLISDKFRLRPIIYLFAGFVVLVLIFGRLKGLTALLGLALTAAILLNYIIPQIIKGANPVTAIIIGSMAIMLLSLYLAHGFNKRTTIALVGTVITLSLSIGLAFLAVGWAKLSGLGSEDAFFLQIGALENLNLKGLLLGGIIIGTLGVLDDITTGQSAVVAELKSANPSFKFIDLYRRGLSVGREHIASLVNTLVLAYAGASFPLLLLFTINNKMPLWFTLNGEIFMEEVIRTLVGSAALILAVPITTAIAAYVWSNSAAEKNPDIHPHIH